MRSSIRTGWRRDVLVGLGACVLTGAVLVFLGWATLHQQRQRAVDAYRLALQAAQLAQQDADQARAEAQRALVDQAADVLGQLGGPDKAEAEALRVTTAAVTPEIPRGAHVLIDKKATSYAVGDIVLFGVGENHYLGRVLAVAKEADCLTIGRNQEADRSVARSAVRGRAVLNTR